MRSCRKIAILFFSLSIFFSFHLLWAGTEEEQLHPSNHHPCELDIHPVRMGFRHIQSGGVGYDKGYSSLDLFISPFSQKDALIFFDLRGHRFTGGKFATNAGLGFRYPHLDTGFAYGVNVFYDYRRSNDTNLNQLGVGAEALGRIWSFRANGYFPTGKRVIDRKYSFHRFSGHNLHIKEKSKRSLTGVDAEAEARIYSHQFAKVFLAAGSYYYNGKHNRNAIGGKARLTGRFFDLGSLSAIASYDRLFGFNFQGEVGLSFALGGKRKILKNNSLRPSTEACHYAEQMANTLDYPVQRNEIIVIAKQKQTLVAKDPTTRAPLYFVHVNNTNSFVGSGSFKSPYNTLLSAQNGSKPGDFIYVNVGDGTFINMDRGITLQNLQKFLGSGMDHPVGTSKGAIIIPAMTPGKKPAITNVNLLGNGINLANSNMVAGFNIVGPSGHGIFASGISSGSIIKQNDIVDSGGGGGSQAGIRIILTPGTIPIGTMEISDNLITSVNAGNDGILIDNATGAGNTGLRVNIHHNCISGNPSEGILIQRLNNGMVGNFFLSGTISNNLLQGNAQEGIYVLSQVPAQSIILDLDIDSNSVVTNGDDGIHFPQANGRLNVTNNFTGSNVTLGIFIETINADRLIGKVNGNKVVSNTSTISLEVEANNTSTIDIEFMNNMVRFDQMQLDNNTGNPVNFRAKVSGNDGVFLSDAITLVP